MEYDSPFVPKVLKVKVGPSTPLIVVVVPPPPVDAIVICPGVEVVIVTLLPATRVPTTQPVPEAMRSWPWATGA
mgnify:CR=1 FL=1